MKISVSENYHVDVENKVTTCVLKIKNWGIPEVIANSVNLLEQYGVQGGLKLTRFNTPSEIVATVRCCSSDEYDERVGKKEARNKAYDKLKSWKVKFMSEYLSALDDIKDTVYEEFRDEFFDNVYNED